MILKVYKYLNILSIDVVAGACICSLFIAEFLDVAMHWTTIMLLGLSVWLIYTFDHLNDAKNIPHEASTPRHRFHQVHFRKLAWTCIAGFALAAFLVFRIPTATVVWGAGLSCFVLGYFLLLFLLKLKSSYHKELMIAVLYASGIMLGPLSIYDESIDGKALIVFGQFMLLAFTNLLMFAVYEVDTDERDKSPSLVRVTGIDSATILLKALIAIQIIGATFLSGQTGFFNLELVLVIMIMVLGCIVFLRKFFAEADLYRVIGDAVFLFPLVGLLLYS